MAVDTVKGLAEDIGNGIVVLVEGTAAEEVALRGVQMDFVVLTGLAVSTCLLKVVGDMSSADLGRVETPG